MKSTRLLTVCIISIVLWSCSGTTKKQPEAVENADASAAMPAADPALLVKDFRTWWTWLYTNVNFLAAFTPTDTAGNPVSKAAFLKALASGNFMPFPGPAIKGSTSYRLHPIPPTAAQGIRDQMARTGKEEYERFTKEGTTLPPFNFTSVSGQVYNAGTTAGKWLVLKCWFIACKPCVAEMPELNRLVSEYAQRKDVLFVSLATDAADKLAAFLKTTPFKYAVVPRQGDYMMKQMGVQSFPTHILINPQGQIVKITTRGDLFMEYLRREIPR